MKGLIMPSIPTLEKLHTTRIAISEDKRQQLVNELNKALAILIDLKLQVKQAHWNVKGMRFIALHELFDMLAKEVDEYIDTTAERATTLGGVALGTVDSVKQSTILDTYPSNAVSGEEHLHALITRYGQVSNFIREHIDSATEQQDLVTADMYTEISRGLDLRLWFLEAHIQDKS
jgi:starvation-inducible DNA-binding protein